MSDEQKTLKERWEARDEITTTSEAMVLMADVLASYHTLKNFDDVCFFAGQHGIPFSPQLFTQLTSSVDKLNRDAMEDYHDYYDGPEEYVESNWLPSSAYC